MNVKRILVGMILPAFLCGCSENERLRLVAQDGDAEAAFELSQRYAEGRNGLPWSPQKGLKWLRIAAEAGNADAQFKLAQMYFKGRGCEKSTEKALSWLEKAAAQEHARAKQFMDSIQLFESVKKGGL